ncbi:M61 family peptidase [Algoriphagus sp.]|uniref:M61 family metallopeptidase n=1 Tax=Algoriphagus sp. TaxID=1872435 RepID=UPI0025F1C945|nr:M61 family peptidase [Algoriphagus sp.]
MHKYTLRCSNPSSQFLQIQLEFTSMNEDEILLQLPAWRAGRYQLANYAQFIRGFQIQNKQGEVIPFKKISKDCWSFEAKKNHSYDIKYDFFSSRMDAGGAWIDDQQIYINFINCCFEIKGTKNHPIELQIDLPFFKQQVCTLPKNKSGNWYADDFQMLVDSTLVASNTLKQWHYNSGNTLFNIWIQGDIHFEKDIFLDHFRKFTDTQIRDFGEFPELEYHFIFQLLPYPHYHGVEHQKGTVITFGPAESLSDPAQMEDLLGVSSHELYHAWNVCRIRPIDLLPYDFSKENYSQAGWMLEGITTYMGDLYLLKSGVFTLDTYLKQIEGVLKKEILNQGWKNQSILESSFDLWLDGYQAGIPDRKVNIYSHGCLICFCLDIMLLEQGCSFPEFMKKAWLIFGKPKIGYTNESFWNLLLDQVQDPMPFQGFYDRFISGKEDLILFFSEKIRQLGLELELTPNPDLLAGKLGILISENKITKIHQDSPAFMDLMIGDQIKYQESESQIHVVTSRINGSFHEFKYESTGKYYPNPILNIGEEIGLRKKWLK